ncbi:hypothetical protein [Fusobacterium varium]|uniref:hypothetical protein n=1 Tax=Fusobacterium varium TaxID=856 RepID=UPI00242D23A3|nr:hypothetical protein [Fusobacterium varium]
MYFLLFGIFIILLLFLIFYIKANDKQTFNKIAEIFIKLNTKILYLNIILFVVIFIKIKEKIRYSYYYRYTGKIDISILVIYNLIIIYFLLKDNKIRDKIKNNIILPLLVYYFYTNIVIFQNIGNWGYFETNILLMILLLSISLILYYKYRDKQYRTASSFLIICIIGLTYYTYNTEKKQNIFPNPYYDYKYESLIFNIPFNGMAYPYYEPIFGLKNQSRLKTRYGILIENGKFKENKIILENLNEDEVIKLAKLCK